MKMLVLVISSVILWDKTNEPILVTTNLPTMSEDWSDGGLTITGESIAGTSLII